MKISLETSQTKGRYIARSSEWSEEAELTYSIMSEKSIIADHTGVPEGLKGKGVGKALFLRLVEDARKNGTKIMPLCPFIKAQFKRHPEFQDLILN